MVSIMWIPFHSILHSQSGSAIWRTPASKQRSPRFCRGTFDDSPYREFLAKCDEHRPWVWKDPRLWLTIYFWKSLLSLDQCRFILLTVIWFRLGIPVSFPVSWRGPWACCLDTLSRPFPSCSAGLRGFARPAGLRECTIANLRGSAPHHKIISQYTPSARKRLRTNSHVEQHHPILEGLQREPDNDQANAKDPHASFGQMIGRPFDKGSEGSDEGRDDANGESRFQPDAQRVRALMRYQAADVAGN